VRKKKATPYWTKVIERARKRKKAGLMPFTKHQISLAGAWVTCACGRQDARIPRYPANTSHGSRSAPLDDILDELGITFYGHVNRGRVKSAKSTLQKIENRAAEILEAARA